MKDAVTQYPTLPFLQIRFALALVVMAVVLAGQRFGLVQAMGAALGPAAIVGHEGASLKFEGHGQPSPP